MEGFRFEAVTLPPAAEAIRGRIRAHLDAERAAGRFKSNDQSWMAFDADFSQRLGQAGFVGLTFPKEFGGQGASALERYVVTEELLSAGAPCGAHWIADRQSGPQILRHGSQRAKAEILPRIARGDCFFGIGMSEPESGSDLAAVRTRATRRNDGWVIDGSKIWTSNAHRVHYLIVLARSETGLSERHAGLTQFIVDMKSPGVSVRPIRNMAGSHEFNQVFFTDCFVPDDMLVGQPGEGWSMVTGELAYERSGPERFLSAYRLMVDLIDAVGPDPDPRQAAEIGRLVAHLASLRRMSLSVAGLLAKGANPATEAALVKDVGTAFEQDLPEVARRVVPAEPNLDGETAFEAALGRTLLYAPSFTLRGGTREILRGMIARGLGLR